MLREFAGRSIRELAHLAAEADAAPNAIVELRHGVVFGSVNKRARIAGAD